MPIDDQELERILASRPRWSPPAGFVSRAAMRASMASREWPVIEPQRGGSILRASGEALATALPACAVGVLLAWIAPATMSGVDALVDGYSRFIAGTTQLMAARPVAVAWASAALSLSFATALVLRVRA